VSRVCFHVDLDAFFASVELLDNPALKGKPVVVGGRPGSRGVVSTASYEARAFGVHSAMPLGEALRRCPQAVFLPVRMERYAALSREVMSIFGRFTPTVRPVSIDEAFLDMTGTERLWGPPRAAAATLKQTVRSETGLSISVGIAPTPYLAKIASGLKKPDGLVCVEPGEEEAFMLALPLSKLWGAGEKTQERFRELGIVTVAQLASLTETSLESIFGRSGGRFLYDAARGRAGGLMEAEAESHSLSTETTFDWDIQDEGTLESVLLELSQEICYRLWDEKQRSRCLFLKLRFSDFSTISRRRTRELAYSDIASTFADAKALFHSAWSGGAVRLLGLGFGELEDSDSPIQGELFGAENEKARLAEKAVFEIEKRGLGELKPARLMGRPGSRGKKNGR